MTFIDGIPEEVVVKVLLPKLRVPLNRRRECDCGTVIVRESLNRIRRIWASSAQWKSIIESTAEWAAWRLARWEAEQFQVESTENEYTLIDIDPSHPLFGKSDVVENFIMNLNAFVKSKAVWVYCRRHPPLSARELHAPLQELSMPELVRLRNVLTKSIFGYNKISSGQIWVTPLDRLD